VDFGPWWGSKRVVAGLATRNFRLPPLGRIIRIYIHTGRLLSPVVFPPRVSYTHNNIIIYPRILSSLSRDIGILYCTGTLIYSYREANVHAFVGDTRGVQVTSLPPLPLHHYPFKVVRNIECRSVCIQMLQFRVSINCFCITTVLYCGRFSWYFFVKPTLTLILSAWRRSVYFF